MRNQQLKPHIKLMPKPTKYTLLKPKKITQKLSELCIKVTNIDGYLHGKFKTKNNMPKCRNIWAQNFMTSVMDSAIRLARLCLY